MLHLPLQIIFFGNPFGFAPFSRHAPRLAQTLANMVMDCNISGENMAYDTLMKVAVRSADELLVILILSRGCLYFNILVLFRLFPLCPPLSHFPSLYFGFLSIYLSLPFSLFLLPCRIVSVN